MEIKKHNPIKWRENELVLMTIYCLVGIAGYWWKIFDRSGEELRKLYDYPFNEKHVPFDYFRNILFPETGLLALLYLFYFWMNLYILPRLSQEVAPGPGFARAAFTRRLRIEFSGPAGQMLKSFLWGLVNAILLMILLGIGWGVVLYHERAYDFVGMDWTSTANRALGMGWRNAAQVVVLYTAYGIFREFTIRKLLQAPRRNPYYIILVNQVCIYAAIYFSIGSILYFFSMVDDKAFFLVFFGAAPSLILGGVTALYWIFPKAGEGRFWQKKNLRRVLISGFCWSIPFAFWMADDSHDLPPALMGLWTGQFLVAFIVWVFYRSRRDQFKQLRGLEEALGRSEADLQFLRSQINPHFLFNALNTLYGTALQEEASKTAGGIQQLGDMMRFMLHENNQDRIPMNKEVEYLKNYIYLQRLRTDSSPQIRIDTEIEEEIPECMIAPMLLIPFVENAFKHGISLREPSWIHIRLNGDSKKILFEIRNSVHARQGTDPEKEKSGIGLKNVLHRLRLLYPARHSFFVNQDEREFFVQLMIEP